MIGCLKLCLFTLIIILCREKVLKANTTTPKMIYYKDTPNILSKYITNKNLKNKVDTKINVETKLIPE